MSEALLYVSLTETRWKKKLFPFWKVGFKETALPNFTKNAAKNPTDSV